MSATTPPPETATPPPATMNPALPYIVPMAGFLALTQVEAYLPVTGGQVSPFWYPLTYAAKVAIVAGLAWACRSSWRDLAPRPGPRDLILAVLLGLLVAFLWVGLDGRYPELPFLGKRSAFDPNTMRPAGKWAFLMVRMVGLVGLIPLIEELFYRSFLMRWIIDAEFTRVPIGRVTPLAVAVTSIVFGFTHPEWLPAVLTGFAWCVLVWRTRSVSACVVSHLVANLALGLYVIATGDWKYW